jgi:hypothetical protein
MVEVNHILLVSDQDNIACHDSLTRREVTSLVLPRNHHRRIRVCPVSVNPGHQ